MRAMVGTTVGQYRITRKIGTGGMGVVYLAEHTLLGRSAAVKMLLPELSQDRIVVSRFFNEARAATSIRHPGIVEIYDFGFGADGSAYIVMEYLEGETLTRRAKKRLISYESALAIVRQIASALAAAHAKGIVHRDLKPDNVFLVPDPDIYGGERIKLLDFGIAKLADAPPRRPESEKSDEGESESGSGQLTRTGAVMGTPAYMAPEQCRGITVDHRADLYSLGCILFRLCTGKPPFTGEGVGDILAAHIHVAPPSLLEAAPGVPPAIAELTARLLVKDPAARLGSAEEVIRLIEEAQSGPGQRTSQQLPGVFGSVSGAHSLPSVPGLRSALDALDASQLTSPSSLSGEDQGSAVSISVVPSPVLANTSKGHLLPGAAAGSPGAPSVHELPTMNTLSEGARSLPHAAAERVRPRFGRIAAIAAGAVALGAVAIFAIFSGTTPPATAPAPPPPLDGVAAPAAPVVPAAPVAPEPAAAILAEPATVPVSIESEPSGAGVFLKVKGSKDRLLGKTPYRGTLRRAEGEVTLVVRRKGLKDERLVVNATAPVQEMVKLSPSARSDKKQGSRQGKGRDASVNPFE
jgi:eukaryotic-like serine/threonine-protein kinase